MLHSRRVDIIPASDPRLGTCPVEAPRFPSLQANAVLRRLAVSGLKKRKHWTPDTQRRGMRKRSESHNRGGPLRRPWVNLPEHGRAHEIAGHKNIPPRCTQVEDMGPCLVPTPLIGRFAGQYRRCSVVIICMTVQL